MSRAGRKARWLTGFPRAGSAGWSPGSGREGEAAFEPRSRRPKTSPTALPDEVVELIVLLRKRLREQGLDAGPDTVAWHLAQRQNLTVSASSVSRHLSRRGLVTAQPAKRPKSSYIRFEAARPNECWQADVTHYRLAGGADAEILTWLDDCSRYALHISAHERVSGPAVLAAFRETTAAHGVPASTLTDIQAGWRLEGPRIVRPAV